MQLLLCLCVSVRLAVCIELFHELYDATKLCLGYGTVPSNMRWLLVLHHIVHIPYILAYLIVTPPGEPVPFVMAFGAALLLFSGGMVLAANCIKFNVRRGTTGDRCFRVAVLLLYVSTRWYTIDGQVLIAADRLHEVCEDDDWDALFRASRYGVAAFSGGIACVIAKQCIASFQPERPNVQKAL